MAERYDAALSRGVFINTLGLIGKLLFPLIVFALTWLFGPEVMGVYFLAFFIAEVAMALVASGFVDAAVLFASRHADAPEREMELYAALGTAFRVPLAVSVLVAGAAMTGAPWLVARFYPDRVGLESALVLAGCALPLMAIANVGVAATKARMRMEYDVVLMSFARPALLLGFSVVAWRFEAGVVGLMWAWLVTYVCLAVGAAFGVARSFSFGRLARAVTTGPLDGAMVRFAVPQSLNMTFNRYLTRLDVMMLGALGSSDFELGLYGSAGLLTSNIREIKLAFSQALAPIAARYHATAERVAFEQTLGSVARWTTSVAVPVVLVVVVLRADILALLDARYAAHDTRFMVWLLVPPLLSCTYGLAGNCIVFTGHSGYNLLNSTLVALLNTGFNLALIPRYGLVGAAIATVLASSLITALQLVELRALEGIGIGFSFVNKPLLGLLIGSAALAALWDPSQQPGLTRAALAIGVSGGFLALMWAVGHEDVRRMISKARGSA